ncbi:thiamine-phosphate kinase [Spiribacter vilamensis]|uniref:Thiamine-monophosphate kinase n=1 Tax=Spiribacter vilamensis TaxID=531306 RepID=A0A4Q8D0Z5_9GAMM|nr:thiamine-phosphate kinase [Spiribacter vilamensis]RZU99016.1 thiamine-phosphate kinase [Spiribacter vilamensis]TVO61980.1 thiamine-phosphate kinase [Spiribacter vilamensis]
MAEPSEFALIRHYLSHLGANRDDVTLGVGDDAAVVTTSGQSLLMALDTLVDGVHFPSDLPAYWIGYRALAVNLSDIAAMGGEPLWALLSLTLPHVDEDWVAGFADGLGTLAARHGVAVIGGDVTRGPLSISLQITGRAPATPLRRDGARAGDRVWVSGRPGEAMAGLGVWQSPAHRDQPRWAGLRRTFVAPRPRVALGRALAGIATAAIDISDGLVADAGHIADSSGVAIDLASASLRPSARLRRWVGEAATVVPPAGGDDYELCFTAPASADTRVAAAARRSRTPVRCIGSVDVGTGVTFDGRSIADGAGGYRHFQD